MRYRLYALALISAFFMAACNNEQAPADSTEPAATTSEPAATEPAATEPAQTPVEPAATPEPAPAVTSAEPIGVPECDDFLTKYEACVMNKVPEASRASFQSGIQQWRDSWRSMAANPDTKAALASACQQSREASKASLSAFGCTDL